MPQNPNIFPHTNLLRSSLCFFVLHSPAASSGGAPHCHQPSSSSSPLISVSQFHFFLTVQPHLRLLLHFPASDWQYGGSQTVEASWVSFFFYLSFSLLVFGASSTPLTFLHFMEACRFRCKLRCFFFLPLLACFWPIWEGVRF